MARMPDIETEWQRFETLTTGRLYKMMRFRQSIFVVEQRSAYPDLDGLDQSAWHLLAWSEDELVGYARVLAPLVRIGRLAVAASLRRRGLGQRLVEEALSHCNEHFPELRVVLSAQAYLVPFYRRFGFEPTGEPYDDFGVSHVDMELLPRR